MSLTKYKQKRSFGKTPEPQGGDPSGKKLRFVVQKHHASHLHYDFRLEMEGVLKSWAVPKGPSMDPSVKRLAMMVEDHPWDYRDFEGIIPEGYGAGTVIVWDEGTYEPAETKKTKKENEKSLMHHLYQGAISFVLHGKKLKGEFSLVKTNERGDNAWLLIKKKDKYSTKEDVEEKDKLRAFQSPVKGEEIMNICNLSPSKKVGEIKTAIEEAILEGKIGNNYEEALKFLLKNKDQFLN